MFYNFESKSFLTVEDFPDLISALRAPIPVPGSSDTLLSW